MKFRVSVASALLLALLLPLVLTKPEKVRASGGDRAGVPPAIKTIYPTFTTITVPGAVYTGAWAINSAGEIVGDYGQNDNEDSAGFLYKNGKFKYFSNGPFTVPTGINDSGLIVGYTGQYSIDGFLYNGKTFTSLHEGTYGDTSSLGINNAGGVVGGSGVGIYATQGFTLRNNEYETVIFPGSYTYAYLTAINNLGEAVGWTSYPQHAYTYRAGQFQNIDVSGAYDSEATGVNDSGTVVGWYFLGSSYAFAYLNGKYLSFGYPGAETFAAGINNAGQVVGEYTFDYQAYYGFVTSPITAADFQ